MSRPRSRSRSHQLGDLLSIVPAQSAQELTEWRRARNGGLTLAPHTYMYLVCFSTTLPVCIRTRHPRTRLARKALGSIGGAVGV